MPNWIGGHVRALPLFWGSDPDPCAGQSQTGGEKSCWYDPDLNQTYLEMAEHYGVAVIPARVRKPRDKAKVEVGVQVVERWIVARLRNRTFFSLAELNQAIRQLLEELNDRKMEHLEKSRRELFEELDQPALRPLPDRPYEYATSKIARVNIDYHVDFEKHFYSVPHTLIHEEVRIRASERMVEIFHKSQREPVAIHPRSHVPGRYSTQTAHMPPKHQKAGEWNAERLVRWAGEIGPHTAQLIQAILSSRQHPEQAFRSCLGILRLSGQYAQSPDGNRLPGGSRSQNAQLPGRQGRPGNAPPLSNPEADLPALPRKHSRQLLLPVRRFAMLIQPLLDKLIQLRLPAFRDGLQEQLNNPKYAELAFEERLALLVDRECTGRHERRTPAANQAGQFPPTGLD